MAKPAAQTIAELQDELKARDRRIEELRGEVDELRNINKRMEEQVEDAGRVIEQWIEAFEMVQSESGWTLSTWVGSGLKLREQYDALLRDWNRFVPEYNAIVAPRRRNVGRPLLASESQQEDVRKRRKAGEPLRSIAEETGLGLRTVVTIVGKDENTDRTTMKYLKRVVPDRAETIRNKARTRTIKGLPRAINATLKSGRDLIKEAKGLK
jgi:hypothetical protein